MAYLVLYQNKIDYLLGAPGQPVHKHISKLTNQVVILAKAQVGVDTGRLRDSISGSVKSGRSVVGRVVASDWKAMMHHEGTSPHKITPKKSKALAFQSRGKIVVTKLVNHPGTKPNRFLTDSLRAVV